MSFRINHVLLLGRYDTSHLVSELGSSFNETIVEQLVGAREQMAL